MERDGESWSGMQFTTEGEKHIHINGSLTGV